ncbi:MAG: GatB/YqeY domain-containing protein [Vicinamibacterales bacterium]
MTLTEKVSADLTAAMKNREASRLGALRMLKAAFMNREVEKGRALDDGEATQVVASLVKQRKDAIEQFDKAGRQDLVAQEAGEIVVLEAYLPPAASPEQIETAVAEAIAETGATSGKDMGKVMKAVMPRLAGRHADGKAVNEAVRRKLGL